MPKKQPFYTPEFKQQIVELIHAGRKPGELANEFGCHVSSIHFWLKQAEGVRPISRSSTLNSAEQEELARLRKENKQLKIERDILSKATAWFASNGVVTPASSTR